MCIRDRYNVAQRVYGPVKEDECNVEVDELLKREDIVRFQKGQ